MHSIPSTRVGKTPAPPDRDSVSRSDVVTSERLDSLPTRLDHPVRPESQTRDPVLADRDSSKEAHWIPIAPRASGGLLAPKTEVLRNPHEIQL